MSEDEIILTHILRCRAIDLAFDKPALTLSQQKQFEDYKARRRAGEPLQYILGTCNFMGFELEVNPSILIPRPETEQLVDAALKHLTLSFPEAFTGNLSKDVIQILDLGTGSGNIAIALAKFVHRSQIIAVDVSSGALEVARANARRHKVEERIEFVQKDLNEYLMYVTPKCFNLVISNPPYILTSQLNSLPQDVQKEPAVALDGGEDGLNFYRTIIKFTPFLLRKGGCLMMEFGDGQAEPIKKLIEAQKVFSNIEIIQDLAGRERIISVKMLG